MKKSINTKFILTLLTMLMAFSLFTITAAAAESASVTGSDGNPYVLSYPDIGILDYYSQNGAASHEIDYSEIKLNGQSINPAHIKILNGSADTSGVQISGGLGNYNQHINARNTTGGAITLFVRLSGLAIGKSNNNPDNLDFTIVVGELRNSTIGTEITYIPSVWTMDSYGFVKDTIEFSLADFTIDVDSIPTKLSELKNVPADKITVTRPNTAINNYSRTNTAPGEYSLTASNNSLTGEAILQIRIVFPRPNMDVNITDSSIKVAEIYAPIITVAESSYVKNIVLQQNLETNNSYDVTLGFGPVDISQTPQVIVNNNNWNTDFPDFELNVTVNGIPGTIDAETLLERLYFGQLCIYETGIVRAVDRDTTTDESLDLVDLAFTLQSEDYVAPQIIANAESGTIQVTHQNVVLVYPGNLDDIVVTPAENNTGGLTRFIYNVTLVPTVTLDFNYGSVPDEKLVNLGDPLTLPTPTRAGYRFAGWKDAQGVIVTSPYIPTADETLTAQWAVIPYVDPTPVTPVDDPPAFRPFDDVYVSDWYDDDTIYVYREGLMTGTADRIFSPRMDTSRAMVVTILHRLEGKPDGGTHTFGDVADGLWYSEAVAWGQNNGIIEGWNGMYRPNDSVTRQELATILARYANYINVDLPESRSQHDFADKASIADFAKDAVNELYQSEVINGKDNNRFDPLGVASRAELAAMLHRFVGMVK